MSKAEELAKCLDLYDDDQTATHAASHLRALEANRQMLVEALKFYADPGDYKAPFTGGLGKLYFDCGENARTALEQAKELT